MKQLQTRFGRFLAHFEAWVIDHEMLRVLYRNFHSVGTKAFRSNHPSPGFIKSVHKKYGIKTIINIRGNNRSSIFKNDFSGQYKLELEACNLLGIDLITIDLSSRDAPDANNILHIKEMFSKIKYPVLIHCKSGADRAGLVSALYLYFVENNSIETSIKELSLLKGHIKWAETGILDTFFQKYLDFAQTNPNITFENWLTNYYDREALRSEFKANKLGKFIVNKILHRE